MIYLKKIWRNYEVDKLKVKALSEIKEQYVAGTKIELIKMYDLLAPVETGNRKR